MTQEQLAHSRELANSAIDKLRCAYCRGLHDTAAELQTCADAFWERNRREYERDHGSVEDLGDCDDQWLAALAHPEDRLESEA